MQPSALFDRVEGVASVAAAHAERHDRDATFPIEAIRAMADSGLSALVLPAELGGQGGDLEEMAAVAIVLSASCVNAALAWTMHCQQVFTLVRHASPSILAEAASVVASGGFLASVTTEPADGRKLQHVGQHLVVDGERMRIARSAAIVTGCEEAAAYLLTMRTSASSAPTDVTLVYASRDDLAVTAGAPTAPLGMRGALSGPFELRGVVPVQNAIGGFGGFNNIAKQTFVPSAHVGWASCWLGVARGALARAISHVRATGSSRLLRSDLLAADLGRCRHDVEVVSALLRTVTREVLQHWSTGSSLDQSEMQIRLNMLKVVAADRCHAVVDRLLSIVSLEYGYMGGDGGHLVRALRDIRSASLNYRDSKLHVASGALALLDRSVSLAEWDGVIRR